jgi:hypothetical protein
MKRRWRRLALLLTVWLTVPATLFSSSPHFECICPDGFKKPLCLDFVFGDMDGCCLEAECDDPVPAAAGEAPCCCKNLAPSTGVSRTSAVPKACPSNADSSLPGVQRRGCEKSLAEIHAFVFDRSHSVSADSPTNPCISGPTPSVIPLAVFAPSLEIPVTSSLPPPPDLVISLCRFLN